MRLARGRGICVEMVSIAESKEEARGWPGPGHGKAAAAAAAAAGRNKLRSVFYSTVAAGVVFLLFARICLLQESLLMDSDGEVRGRTELPEASWEFQRRLTYGTVLWKRFDSVAVGEEDVADLRAASPMFNVSDPRVVQVVKLVKKYTEPFQAYPGVSEGFGSQKQGRIEMLRMAAVSTSLMQCCVHVRVVGGKVYFRYGHFLDTGYRLNRANDLVTFLQKTVDVYGLQDLKVELLFNTCDHPLAPSSSFPMDRANYLVWSNHVVDGFVDVLAPDFLDWGEDYMPSKEELARQVPWREKEAKAVFRGATTNYNMHGFNWGSSGRLRLHAMTDSYPDLLEARVSRWSHLAKGQSWGMKKDGLSLGSRMNFTAKNAYKYEILADGGLGTTRLCGVLMTNRVVVRQSSPFYQFYDPLLKPGHHFMEVDHQFRDLAETVAFMRDHDAEMEQVVENAHKELGWVCSPEGRMMSYAVLLVKYQQMIDDVSQIRAPTPEHMCRYGAVRSVFKHRQIMRPDCLRTEPEPVLDVAGCPTVCGYAGSLEKHWFWLEASELAGWGNHS